MFILLITVCIPTVNASTGPGTAAVKAVLDKAMEIQTRADLQGDAHIKDRTELIKKLISDNFLDEEMAAGSLKDNWNKLSAAQKAEFQKLFTDLFQDSYTRMVLNFLQQEKIEYLGESKEGQGLRVKTVILRANEKIPVNYDLAQKGSRWLIRDVEIDGLSITQNYYDTFRRVIQASSFDGLLQKMRLQTQAIQRRSAS